MKSLDIQITHPVGLHARPASLFVKTSQKFSSTISISYKEKSVNAKSILGLLGLGVIQGANISINADGADEVAALAALKALVEDNFGE